MSIEESYVSFETAKLLKEKGFDVAVRTSIELIYLDRDDTEMIFHLDADNWNAYSSEHRLSCPTLQLACKWMREVHNLCIEPYRTASGYLYTISKIWTGSEIYSDEFNGDDEDSGQWTTYEKACEAAIKYCLKNLI